MAKNFVTGFDSLICNTSDVSKKETPQEHITSSSDDIIDGNYTRVTIAIDAQKLQTLKMICITKQTKMRKIINDLIGDFISKTNMEQKM